MASEVRRRGFLADLERFRDYCAARRTKPLTLTVDVTERYARRVLGLKRGDLTTADGIALTCRGSPAYRMRKRFEAGQS
jgi:hypothetical protein